MRHTARSSRLIAFLVAPLVCALVLAVALPASLSVSSLASPVISGLLPAPYGLLFQGIASTFTFLPGTDITDGKGFHPAVSFVPWEGTEQMSELLQLPLTPTILRSGADDQTVLRFEVFAKQDLWISGLALRMTAVDDSIAQDDWPIANLTPYCGQVPTDPATPITYQKISSDFLSNWSQLVLQGFEDAHGRHVLLPAGDRLRCEVRAKMKEHRNVGSFLLGFDTSSTKVNSRYFFVSDPVRGNDIDIQTAISAPMLWSVADPVATPLTPWLVHGSIRAAAVGDASDTTLFIGGRFTRAGGQLRRYLAAIDQTTGNALSWTPNPGPISPSAGVYTLVRDGKTLYVGGNFTHIAGQARNHVAAFDAVSLKLLPWNPTVLPKTGSFTVRSLQIADSTVFIGGDFAGGLTAVDKKSGTKLLFWKTSVHGNVNALSLAAGGKRLLVGGAFDTVRASLAASAAQSRTDIAMLDTKTGDLLPWVGPKISGEVETLGNDSTYLYVGGDFTTNSGQHALHNYVALQLQGGHPWIPLSIAFPGAVHTISAPDADGTRLVGGHDVPKSAFAPGGLAAVSPNSHGAAWNPYVNVLYAAPKDTFAILSGYSNWTLVLGSAGEGKDVRIGVFN